MGQPTEAQRVRGYILTQANKLTIPELVSKVRTDTAPLREAAASVPEDRFFDRPNSEDWSAAEVFTHILDMNDRGAELIAATEEERVVVVPRRAAQVAVRADGADGLPTVEQHNAIAGLVIEVHARCINTLPPIQRKGIVRNTAVEVGDALHARIVAVDVQITFHRAEIRARQHVPGHNERIQHALERGTVQRLEIRCQRIRQCIAGGM